MSDSSVYDIPPSIPPSTALAPPTKPVPLCETGGPLLLELGCGNFYEPGWVGVDMLPLPGVHVVCNLGKEPWPWPDNSVDEARCGHMLEHLWPEERIHFFNELYRVLKVGAQILISTPDWASNRAYGDLDHKWPPVCPQFYFSMDPKFRLVSQPHLWGKLNVHFNYTFNYRLADWLVPKADDTRNYAIQNYKDACQDLLATLTKVDPKETEKRMSEPELQKLLGK